MDGRARWVGLLVMVGFGTAVLSYLGFTLLWRAPFEVLEQRVLSEEVHIGQPVLIESHAIRRAAAKMQHDRFILVVESVRPGVVLPYLCHRDNVPGGFTPPSDEPVTVTFKVPTEPHCPPGIAEYRQQTLVVGAVRSWTIHPPVLRFRLVE